MVAAVKGQAIGAAVPGFNLGQLRELHLKVPDVDTQRQIVDVLSTIDDLIQNNRRRIHALEQMVQTIYREWFVHLRFPGHENASLVDSQLGPLPEGWTCSSLGQAATWLSGGTPKTSESLYWGGEIPWITSGTLTSLILDRSERRVTQAGVENGTRLVPRDALLFVVRGMSLVKEFRVGIADIPLAFGHDDELHPLRYVPRWHWAGDDEPGTDDPHDP
jgi:type I restriction enzyme S subunit